jgi:hypothetical protein
MVLVTMHIFPEARRLVRNSAEQRRLCRLCSEERATRQNVNWFGAESAEGARMRPKRHGVCSVLKAQI